MTVFNASNTEWKDGKYSLFLGQAPALHDTINMNYPQLDKLTQKQITNRWVFDEFNHEQSRIDLVTCRNKGQTNIYQATLMNLAYQWEADSVASRAIAPLFAPFVTNSELWELLLENTNMEVTHAKTYSEIVRQCVPDPSEVFKMVMENEKTLGRASTVNKAFDDLAYQGAWYTIEGCQCQSQENDMYDAVFVALCALYFLERIQFMASFAATFAVVEQGYFQSIGKAVQKIMLDELDCHAAADKAILEIELATERGQRALQRNKALIQRMFWEVLTKEFDWSDYLLSEGRAIVGLTPSLLKDHTIEFADEPAQLLGLELPCTRIQTVTLPWMYNWIDIDKTQNANQEADNNNYVLNVVKDDLGDEVLDWDGSMALPSFREGRDLIGTP